MAEALLDPLCDCFCKPVLTYAFASPQLVKQIKKNSYPNINPPGDQHAGCELNTRGKPVCKRLGLAVDIYVPGFSAHQAACWIVSNTPFDRLYFYSKHRPFHVSIGPENSKAIVFMQGFLGGRHQPRVMKSEGFLQLRE